MYDVKAIPFRRNTKRKYNQDSLGCHLAINVEMYNNKIKRAKLLLVIYQEGKKISLQSYLKALESGDISASEKALAQHEQYREKIEEEQRKIEIYEVRKDNIETKLLKINVTTHHEGHEEHEEFYNTDLPDGSQVF